MEALLNEAEKHGMFRRTCDLCGCELKDKIIDGKLLGVKNWCWMCSDCHEEQGSGFGEGLGQLFQITDGNQLVKIKG